MVIGEAGSGKTTLLNSFLNYIYGIKFEDNFRYKIINEELGISQNESKTSDVNIYNIKETNGFPPFQIIGTPGFFNSGEVSKNKLIFLKITLFYRVRELFCPENFCFFAFFPRYSFLNF